MAAGSTRILPDLVARVCAKARAIGNEAFVARAKRQPTGTASRGQRASSRICARGGAAHRVDQAMAPGRRHGDGVGAEHAGGGEDHLHHRALAHHDRHVQRRAVFIDQFRRLFADMQQLQFGFAFDHRQHGLDAADGRNAVDRGGDRDRIRFRSSRPAIGVDESARAVAQEQTHHLALAHQAAVDRNVEPAGQRLVGVGGEDDQIAERVFEVFEDAGAGVARRDADARHLQVEFLLPAVVCGVLSQHAPSDQQIAHLAQPLRRRIERLGVDPHLQQAQDRLRGQRHRHRMSHRSPVAGGEVGRMDDHRARLTVYGHGIFRHRGCGSVAAGLGARLKRFVLAPQRRARLIPAKR